jgi:phosphoribosylformylglycinamidine synthase
LGSDGLRHAIPPTLLISAIGISDNIFASITMDLKSVDNVLYLIGEMNPVLGGSHFNLVYPHQAVIEKVPQFSPSARDSYRKIYRAIRQQMIKSIHDLSEGGLAVAAAEMCIGGRVGLELKIDRVDPIRFLFGETNGCLLVEIAPKDCHSFEQHFKDVPFQKLGTITPSEKILIYNNATELINCPVDRLVTAWKREIES